MCILLFPRFKMWHTLTSSKYTWSQKQIRFQKLNEIHKRRFSHWNCHTDSLTSVARSHHCHQALAMINNATNDSLANWIVLWTLTYQVLLVMYVIDESPRKPVTSCIYLQWKWIKLLWTPVISKRGIILIQQAWLKFGGQTCIASLLA